MVNRIAVADCMVKQVLFPAGITDDVVEMFMLEVMMFPDFSSAVM